MYSSDNWPSDHGRYKKGTSVLHDVTSQDFRVPYKTDQAVGVLCSLQNVFKCAAHLLEKLHTLYKPAVGNDLAAYISRMS